VETGCVNEVEVGGCMSLEEWGKQNGNSFSVMLSMSYNPTLAGSHLWTNMQWSMSKR